MSIFCFRSPCASISTCSRFSLSILVSSGLIGGGGLVEVVLDSDGISSTEATILSDRSMTYAFATSSVWTS